MENRKDSYEENLIQIIMRTVAQLEAYRMALKDAEIHDKCHNLKEGDEQDSKIIYFQPKSV